MNIAQLHDLLDRLIRTGIAPETKVTVLTDDLALRNESDRWNGGVSELHCAQMATTHYTVDNSPKMSLSYDKGTVLVLTGIGGNLSDCGQIHEEYFHED